MSPKEHAVADAALRPYSCASYDEVFSKIAEHVGASVEDVEQIIDDLIADKTITDRYVPMLAPTPQVDGPFQIAQPWYEKGEFWGQPRMTLIE
jgi:hypothetical protein